MKLESTKIKIFVFEWDQAVEASPIKDTSSLVSCSFIGRLRHTPHLNVLPTAYWFTPSKPLKMYELAYI